VDVLVDVELEVDEGEAQVQKLQADSLLVLGKSHAADIDFLGLIDPRGDLLPEG
jgi:hypothetical protein